VKKNYAVVDIETTGTDPKTDRIIQFGCVLIENGKIVTHFSTDINPDQNIPARQGLQVGGCWDVLDGSAGSSTLSGHGPITSAPTSPSPPERASKSVSLS
jgi:hypothetical protein